MGWSTNAQAATGISLARDDRPSGAKSPSPLRGGVGVGVLNVERIGRSEPPPLVPPLKGEGDDYECSANSCAATRGWSVPYAPSVVLLSRTNSNMSLTLIIIYAFLRSSRGGAGPRGRLRVADETTGACCYRLPGPIRILNVLIGLLIISGCHRRLPNFHLPSSLASLMNF
jgi:hypothetical protein